MTFRWAYFKELLRFNLVFANTAMAGKIQEKQAEKLKADPNALTGMLVRKTFILPFLFIFIIYSVIFIGVDFAALPMYLDLLVLVMLVVPILQSFTTFYNLFYESADTAAYMPLPVYPQELFLARLLVAGMSGYMFLSPMVTYFALFYWRNGFSWPVIVIGPLLWTLVLFLLYMVLNVAILQGLVKTALFSRMSTRFLTFTNVAAQALAVIALVLCIWTLQGLIDIEQTKLVSRPGPLSGLLLSHWQWPAWALIFTGLVLLALWIYRHVAVHYYDSLFGVDQVKKTQRKAPRRDLLQRRSNEGLGRMLWRYNWQLLDDVTLVSQTLVTPVILPVFLFLPQAFTGSRLPAPFYREPGLMLLLGLLVGLGLGVMVNIMGTSLAAYIVSMDRENFAYICALPIDMTRYLKEKWRFATVVSGVLPSLVLVGLAAWSGIWPALPPALLVFWLIHMLADANWLLYDLTHLNTGWQSATDLMNRMPRGLMMTLMFVGFAGAFGGVAGLAALGYFKGAGLALAVTGAVIVLVLAALGLAFQMRRKAVRF